MEIYFGVEQTEKFYLPGTNKGQWIELRKLNAAQKAEYSNKIGQFSTVTPEGVIQVDMGRAGDVDKILFALVVSKYAVSVREGDEVKLIEGSDPSEWDQLYNTMDAALVDPLRELATKLNPWLSPSGDEEQKKTNA